MLLQTIANFGRNVFFTPHEVKAPQNEAEVLDALRGSGGHRIRVIGRLHSWSRCIVGDELVLDLHKLNAVHVERRPEGIWVRVGAGCQVKRLLAELDRLAAGTLPTVGLITEQSIGGAIATGTHGSGKHSISHYIDEVRIAAFDPQSGEPTIRTITAGDELRAARCSLGGLGVVLSVGFWSRPAYRVEEHFREHNTLAEVCAEEDRYPLTQFYYIPWSWKYFGHHRREVDAPRNRLAGLYHFYFFWSFDIAFRLAILLLELLRFRWCTRLFFRQIAPRTVIRNWRVTDTSHRMLVMEHELFRHIEIEMFVAPDKLADLMTFATGLIQYFDGDSCAIDERWRQPLIDAGVWRTIEPHRGTYTHRFQICVRRVLTDDTLLSMASDCDGHCYAVSFISFSRPSCHAKFTRFAEALAAATIELFDARPHWGKFCPVTTQQVQRLYPQLETFRETCQRFDPDGRFRNDWLDAILTR